MKNYDVVVVGAGAAGGIVAGVMAEAGKSVLLLERGPNMSFEDVGRDHLRNQRISLYGHNVGPDIKGDPRTFTNLLGETRIVRPHQGGYNNNAACVGSGTRVYGAQAWRFMEKDFRMASTYGVPPGSSLADWPLTYEDLEPYYERAEWEIGVSGDGAANLHQAPRKRGYPMPPVSDTVQSKILRQGAGRLGWNTFPLPLLINSVPYGGRAACIHCQHCVGFACPTDAKNGSQNTMLPRALATGNCELITGARAEKIATDGQGRVTGLTYLVTENGTSRREQASAKAVVLSGGAVESARMLLLSATSQEPNGLGNEHDNVGRNLQGHYYPGAMGLMDETTYDGIGPGASIATCQFSHGNPGIIGGGMLANEFTKLPIIHWYNAIPGDVPKWGEANKCWMRESYGKLIHIQGPIHDIPSPEARVTLDPLVRDQFDLPVANISGVAHPECVRTAAFMHEKAVEWLKASGAVRVWGGPPGLHLSGGQHQAGTCRMGNNPQTSVTDKWGRVHSHDNLYVMDGSVNVTNGGFNPVLTIMALAFRNAEHLTQTL